MTALTAESTSFHMVAATLSGSAAAYKAYSTQVSLHPESSRRRVTADSHTHRIVTARVGDRRR